MKYKNRKRFMGIMLAGVFMMGMTAGCGGNADSKTAEETEVPAAAEETEEAKQEKLPFEIYKSNQLEGTAEFQLADISFHPQVGPSKPVAYGHVMTVSDESKSYLDVAVRMKNLSGKNLYVSDIFYARMELEGEEYYADVVTEIKDGTDLEQSHEMQADEETIVHYLYELDKNLSVGDITLRMVCSKDETKVYEGTVNCGEFRENHAKMKKGEKWKTKDYVMEITGTQLSDELHAQLEDTYSGVVYYLENKDKDKTYAIVSTKIKNKGKDKLDPSIVAGMHAIYSSKKGTKVSEMCSVVTESESGQNLSNFAPDKIAPGTERVVYFVMEVDKKVKAKDLNIIITFDNMVYQLSAK